MLTTLALVQNGSASLTDGTLFMIYFLQASLIPRVRMLNRSMDLLMRMSITADRLMPLFTAREYLKTRETHSLPEKGPGAIRCESCSFAYPGQDHSLHDISLTITAGETIGLVGPTGAGKSTLALLLCRFYDPDCGVVSIDDNDIRNYPLEHIRRQFALVFQDTFLFSASIGDNIAYGNPAARRDEIERAARLANIHDFIATLSNGYDTEIGERGVTLSGGQRQRVSIARALLRKPRFLILDDATSALDTRTEEAIGRSITALHETSTIIVIAHRFSSIAGADRVYVLEHGRITETGTPGELNVLGTAFSRILNIHHPENRHP